MISIMTMECLNRIQAGSRPYVMMRLSRRCSSRRDRRQRELHVSRSESLRWAKQATVISYWPVLRSTRSCASWEPSQWPTLLSITKVRWRKDKLMALITRLLDASWSSRTIISITLELSCFLTNSKRSQSMWAGAARSSSHSHYRVLLEKYSFTASRCRGSILWFPAKIAKLCEATVSSTWWKPTGMYSTMII